MENTQTPEQLIADLQKENGQLKVTLEAKEQELLLATKKNSELTDKLAAGDSELLNALTVIEELEKKLAVADEAVAASEAPSFTYEGDEYEVIIPKVEIPGIGIRTALEVATDEEAQAYLVKAGTEGSVIQKKA